MDNSSNNKQNHSMYIYTALIFVVALLLIIIAFFGQRNISNIQKNVDTVVESTETVTEAITDAPSEAPTDKPEPDDYAKLSNAFEALSAENESLKGTVTVYELLLSANKSVSETDFETAKTTLAEINPDTLTDEQKILYDQIISTINE